MPEILNESREKNDNIIDKMIILNENPELQSNADQMFKKLLCDYFFNSEFSESLKFKGFLSKFESPPFLKKIGNLLDMDINELRSYVEGEVINDSLVGRIMLSTPFLSSFYSNYPPEFKKLPQEIKSELLEIIEEKNNEIISTYEKMLVEIEADKKRKIVSIVALILKSIHHETLTPLNKLPKPARDIIGSIFNNINDIFSADEKQISNLDNDSNINELIKTFFKIRQYNEIAEMSEIYKKELEKYKKRCLFVSGDATTD